MLENTFNNCIFLELEENGFNTPDEKVGELINKDLAQTKNLFALKLLFETLLINFHLEFFVILPYKKTGYVFSKIFIRFFSLEITYHNRPLKRYGKMHNSVSL